MPAHSIEARRRHWIPGALAVLVLALVPGCGEDDETTGRTNTRGPEATTAPTTEAPVRRRPSIGAFAQSERRPSFPPTATRERTRARSAPSGGAPGTDEAEATRTDPNDALERALTQAFGDPSTCLSDEARDEAGETLRLQVTVRVTVTGRPVSASVTGGDLPEADLECMTRRAESLRLPGPVPDAPRTVSTAIEYEVHDTRTNETERTPADPGRHRGTLRADRTLDPAGTETERPRGFVQPSSTLPAQVPAGN